MFYAGKNVTIIVGSGPGGGYYVWAELVAAHWGRHIPGTPTVTLRSVPGAGGVAAANALFAAGGDGLTVGALHNVLVVPQLLQMAGANYDLAAMRVIGSPASQSEGLLLRDPYRTLDDAKASPRPLRIGTSAGGASHALPAILNEILGHPFELVPGREGEENRLGLLRGEFDGVATTYASGRIQLGAAMDAGHIHWVAQSGVRLPDGTWVRGSNLPDAPTVWELGIPAALRPVAEVALNSLAFSRPFVTPPGIPDDRLETLRAAFWRAVHDPALIDDARRRGLIDDLKPVQGPTIEAAYRRSLALPPSLIPRLRAVMGLEESALR